MQSPFLVNISTFAGKPGAGTDSQVDAVIEGLRTSGSWVAEDTKVKFTGTVEVIDGGFVVEGDVATSWVGECRRCVGEADGTIDVQIREIFEKNATEGETYPIEGDNINLEPVLRETVMLELPVAPLCKPDCQGLCAECGANRNETDCGHKLEITDDRWAALDQLKDLN